ncbi:MAG: hypothetical protein ABSB35_42235 [Bryobacteraceae bacterium]
MKNQLCIRLLRALVIIVPAATLWGGPIAYNFQTLNNSGDLAFNQLLGINEPGVIAGYFGDGVTLPNQGS